MTAPPTPIVGEFIDAVVDDEPRARRLLSEWPELLNARWHLGETVLHFLAVEGFVDGVRRLVEWGADVNLPNRLGGPPLLDCVVLGHDALVSLLLRHGADPNVISDAMGSPLHVAVSRCDVGLVKLLLASGADPNIRNSGGETVLDPLPMRADGRDEIIAMLAARRIRER